MLNNSLNAWLSEDFLRIFDADFIILAYKNRVDFFAVLAKMTRKTHNF